MAVLIIVISAGFALADQGDDAFNFATGLLINRDYQAALDEYDDYLKNHPGHARTPEAVFRRGECLYRLERNAEAIDALAAYERANPRGEHRPISAWWRGAMLLKAENPAAAAEAYAVIIQNFPEHALAPAALYWRGESLLRSEEAEAAVGVLKQALEKAEGEYRPMAISSLGWAEYGRGNREEALARFRTLTADHPDHEAAPAAAMQIAVILVELGRRDEAQRAYEQVGARYGRRYGREVLAGRAQIAFDGGEFARAAELFQKAAEDFPDDPAADSTRMNAATAWYRAGDYERAAALFARAAGNEAIVHHEAIFWMGKSLEAQKKFAEALPLFERASLTGDVALKSRAFLGRGDAQLALEQYDGAAESYLAAGAAAPDTEWARAALYNAAFARSRQGRIDEAIAISRDLLARLQGREGDELRGPAAFALGEFLFVKGEFAEAERVFAGLIDNPAPGISVSSPMSRRAWCRFQLGGLDEAQAQFASLIKNHPQAQEAAEAAFMIGHILVAREKYEEAIVAFDRCRGAYSESEFARRAAVERGVSLFRLGRFDEAAEDLRANDAPRARLFLAEVALERGQTDEAERIFSELLGRDIPTDQSAAALMGLGFALRAQGKYGAAANRFLEYAEKFAGRPDVPAALFQAARSLEQAGNSAAAIEQYDRLQREYPEDVLAPDAAFRRALIIARVSEEDPRQGIAALEQFERSHPAGVYLPDSIYERAWLHGERERRAAVFEELVRRYPNHPLASDAAFRLGEFAYADRDFDNAIRLYRRALENEESAAARDMVYYKLGWAFLEKRDDAQALAAFRKVVEEHPGSDVAAECAFRAGVILRDQGRDEEAGAILLRTTGEFSHRALFERGQMALKEGRSEEALALFTEALKAGGESDIAMEIRLGLGYAQLRMGAHRDAEANMLEIIKNSETVTAARAQYALGEIRFARREYADAGREFLKVAFLYGYDEWKLKGYLMAGKSFENAGSKDRALLYYGEAVKLAPDSDEAKEAREAITRLGE